MNGIDTEKEEEITAEERNTVEARLLEGSSSYEAPRPAKTTKMVLMKIFRSSFKDQLSM